MNQTPPDTPDLLDAEPGDNQPPVLSVGELSGAVKRTVEDSFGYVRVRGEVSGFKRAASGHLYMTLKDADAMIDGVCWRGSAGRLEVQPEDGLEVIATGRVTTYPARSKYQLVIERLEVAGEGALLKMIEERRKRLAAEGLKVEDMSPGEVRGMWPGPVTNDGKGIFFVSHTGDIYPSGFLPYRTGNVRVDDPVEVYRENPVFETLRDPAALKGKCGACPFNVICGGSRARSFAMTDDPLSSEPCCPYLPAGFLAA